jgi:hypothetical protein
MRSTLFPSLLALGILVGGCSQRHVAAPATASSPARNGAGERSPDHSPAIAQVDLAPERGAIASPGSTSGSRQDGSPPVLETKGEVLPQPRKESDVAVHIDWEARARQVAPGTARVEVERQLPPSTRGPGASFEPVTEFSRAGAATVTYLLDAAHRARVHYLVDEKGRYALASVSVDKVPRDP